MDFSLLTIKELHNGLVKKRFSSVDLTKYCLRRIEVLERKLKAFISLCPEKALDKAKIVDRKIARGIKTSLLAGIPVAIKDSFITKNLKSTTASQILEDFKPVYDAAAVARLKQNDAVIIGKTNLDEFSLGFTTEASAFQISSNPWDLSRTPGGSSGGSAAAVSSGEAIYALCSEHFDSIRQPAAWCNLVGFKPTYGRASRYGIVTMSSSLECPGPMTKTVEDAALVLEAISGWSPDDATTIKEPVPRYSRSLSSQVKGIKIGLPREYFTNDVELGVRKAVSKAISVFRKLGAEFNEIDLFPVRFASAVYGVLYRAEVASNLARYDGIRYGHWQESESLQKMYGNNRRVFGPLVKKQILTDVRAVARGQFEDVYRKALRVRELIARDFKERVFREVDFVIGPMSPCVAFKKGFFRDGEYQRTVKTDRFRPLVDAIAGLPTLCGYPGISVPCGFSKGLPVGLQIYGPALSEQKILNLAFAYEQETKWYKIKPPLKVNGK